MGISTKKAVFAKILRSQVQMDNEWNCDRIGAFALQLVVATIGNHGLAVNFNESHSELYGE